MARKRASDGDKRPFGANYRKYDPSKEGYGNVRDWNSVADVMGLGEAQGIVAVANMTPLQILGLDVMPTTTAELKTAYRRAAKTVHPDQGGSDKAFRAVNAAYTILLSEI